MLPTEILSCHQASPNGTRCFGATRQAIYTSLAALPQTMLECLIFVLCVFWTPKNLYTFPTQHSKFKGRLREITEMLKPELPFFLHPPGRGMRLSTWLLSQSHSARARGFVGERWKLLFFLSSCQEAVLCTAVPFDLNTIKSQMCVLSCFLNKPQVCTHFRVYSR